MLFLVSQLASNAEMARIELCIYETAESSCSSERYFSILKNILSERRIRMKYLLLEDMVVGKSAIGNAAPSFHASY